MINVEMTKANGVTLATENTICNENVNVTIANGENLIAENIKKDVQIADVVGTLESGGGDDTALIGLIQRDLTEFVIPSGVTHIGDNAFNSYKSLTSVTIPNSVINIGGNAFGNCSNLTSITIPNGVRTIAGGAFAACSRLTSVTIPNSVINIGGNAFIGDTAMENFVVERGFNTSFTISYSTKFSRETLRAIIDNYADRTGQPALKLTIGSTNLAKLTEEDIAVATNKNITLA